MVPMARAGSLKVKVTWVGTIAVMDPFAGEVPTRMLCAAAVVVAETRRAVAATTTASARGTQRVGNRFGWLVT
jgi:hypothetical protein